VALVAAAFVLKVAIASCTYGSTDALLYEADLTTIRREGPVVLYRDGITTQWCGQPGQRLCPPFIHPPFIVLALQGWGALADLSGLPLRFWLRLTCAIADVGSFALLLGHCRRQQDDPQARVALALFAISPIAILVSGFHGNTDPIMVFFMLLSVCLVEHRRPAWLAGAALGLAVSIKILPVLVAPAAMLALPTARRRVEFGAGAVAVALAGALPVLVLAPELIMTRVLGYGSQSGPWGLSLLALVFLQSPRLDWLHDLYARYGKILGLGLVLVASWWPWPRPDRNGLFLRAGFVVSVFLSSTPGFGVQYLAWLVPWVVALGPRLTASYYLVGALFLFAYYTAGAGGFPWDLASSLERRAWTPSVLGLGLVCWVVVCLTTLGYARALRARPGHRA
jgi:hypothetical protein